MAVEAAGGDMRSGIGARLRAGRELKGLTVLQAAEKLHLDAKILESLESEDFAALGAPVYARGHLRHYAELIGESAAQLQELYSNTTSTAQPDLTRIARAEAPSDSGKLVMPALLVLGGFALVGAVWWIMSLSGGRPGAAPARDETPSGQIAASTPAADTATATATGSETRPAARSAADVVSAAPSPPAAVQGQGKGTVGPPPEVAPKHSREAVVTLRFSADSWAEVYDASGERLFYDVGAADSVRTLKGTPPLRVVLGNAPGVAVEVNGRPASITKLVQTDGSAQFTINRTGRAVRAKPASDGG
jgi:cytoskeleton protein RodZ